jgi:hypothetical protein
MCKHMLISLINIVIIAGHTGQLHYPSGLTLHLHYKDLLGIAVQGNTHV